MRAYLRTSPSSVWRDFSPAKPGAVSYDNRIVRPDSGPNSRKMVVSSTNETPSGMKVAFWNRFVPNTDCWYWSDVACSVGSLNDCLYCSRPPLNSTRRYRFNG